MLHLSSWMTTLPMMLIGLVGILLVIGVIVLAVMLLNRLTNRK
ncbi:oxaloacetate decarboxylase [Faecalibacterium prausnitzii]|nr:oxaloacetate decarboxylase [Faecalibacterium prausnitzii]PDX69262.1 oxaloacetate decarboxylase [Faecalibacterium prausnitzii]